MKGKMIKLKNRRVILAGPKDGNYVLAFKMLCEGREIKKTSVTVSLEALTAIYQLTAEEALRLFEERENHGND